jgi:hypothetical protein
VWMGADQGSWGAGSDPPGRPPTPRALRFFCPADRAPPPAPPQNPRVPRGYPYEVFTVGPFEIF